MQNPNMSWVCQERKCQHRFIIILVIQIEVLGRWLFGNGNVTWQFPGNFGSQKGRTQFLTMEPLTADNMLGLKNAEPASTSFAEDASKKHNASQQILRAR